MAFTTLKNKGILLLCCKY